MVGGKILRDNQRVTTRLYWKGAENARQAGEYFDQRDQTEEFVSWRESQRIGTSFDLDDDFND